MRSGVCRPWKMSMNAKAKMLCTQKTVVVSTLADVIAKIMKDPSRIEYQAQHDTYREVSWKNIRFLR